MDSLFVIAIECPHYPNDYCIIYEIADFYLETEIQWEFIAVIEIVFFNDLHNLDFEMYELKERKKMRVCARTDVFFSGIGTGREKWQEKKSVN